MQNERQTAGETARPTNPFEEKIARLNRERNQEVYRVKRKIEALRLKNAEMKEAVRDNNIEIQHLCHEVDHIRAAYKEGVAKVYDMMQDHYADPEHHPLNRRLHVFFGLHPEVLELWKAERQAIKDRIAAEEGGAL